MNHQIAVRFLIIAFPCAHAFRVTNQKAVQGETGGEGAADDRVDFGFMTTDVRYPGHNPGVFGTISEWWGGRAVTDEKEEIVQHHFCQKRGSRDETYFASSFCYWLPEFKDGARTAAGSPLIWQGGKYPQGKSLGMLASASGKCMRLSVCHNNAQGEKGDVDKHSFYEEVAVPEGCLKEQWIDKHCVDIYDTGVGADLSARSDECQEVQSRYTTALQKHNTCVGQLNSLPGQISQYPDKIRRAEDEVIRLGTVAEYAQRHEHEEQRRMVRRCEKYSRLKNWHSLTSYMLGADSTERMLGFMTHCSYPTYPHDNGDGSNYDEMARYQQNLQLHDACKECDRAKDDLRRAQSKSNRADQDLRSGQQKPGQLRSEKANKESQLRSWQSQAPGLKAAKETMDEEWLPQKNGCFTTYADYKSGKAGSVSACAPNFYEASCERQCVELQARDGCGVLEGTRPGAVTGSGGISVPCAPPQPSWILTPFTYDSVKVEGHTEQCARIEENQKPHYAQRLLKTGWLWKKGRVNGWDKRFFVLESGDGVRSALLRYFDKDPARFADADEREGKGIILHDALRLKEKGGTHYNFKNGEECFKLYHFYRDYRFCVVVKEGVEDMDVKEASSSADQAAQERDDWLRLLGEQIPEQ